MFSLSNKTFILNNFFTERNLDFLLLSETWLIPDDLSPFMDLLPLDCSFLNTPCITSRGGGLASIFNNSFSIYYSMCCNILTASIQQGFYL